ncbi:MAG: N-6 DNA methylase, partial [Planctomycetaceae bacterium]|nr:N-6 DNA methylase [Planctomycetaceae bacterium]
MKHEELGAYYESILDKEVRKEGGVYYTPPFIVEYMVANTVGELLKDKTPEEMAKLTIVDPACGGGVFLLGAYQYLLDWHEKHCGKLTLTQRQKILMNNIFGVDIDPLAVEITKYSLSMTCSEGKDFSLDLDQNIRCGNSLIDTEEFDWKKDFSRIFKQGGFNIVIGNPPYVEAKKLKKIAVNLKHYDVHSGTADLSVYFLERGLNLLKNKGLLMFITTNKFFNTEYGK